MFYDPHDLVQMFGNIEFSSQPSEFLLQQKLKEFLEYMPEEEAHYLPFAFFSISTIAVKKNK